MFGLDTGLLILLLLCLLLACTFEFVNGFHDTANAVATVIYTNSLKPNVAVVWSGIFNFIGVLTGGIGVAMGIVYLLPIEVLVDQDKFHSIGMILSLLLTAIIWNLGTWYLGIPCSSSHTLIGSVLGVGIGYSLLPDVTGNHVNWGKASDIGLSLLVSPIFGFSLTVFLMFILRRMVKSSEVLFKEPAKHKAPPLWIRIILIATCTGVSWAHGSNDGQKGVGLIMLILISIVPGYFALNHEKNLDGLVQASTAFERSLSSIDMSRVNPADTLQLQKAKKNLTEISTVIGTRTKASELNEEENTEVRKDIISAAKGVEKMIKKGLLPISEEQKLRMEGEIKAVKKYTDYAPQWVIVLISVSLGLGTMIGWKRIVKTIGEKIGKEHLTYAQGASAELVASSTIAAVTYLGLPVSTTHVLSSGIAGSMVASKGIKNLQPKTIKNIAIAWLLTLPVCIAMSAGLFLLFRAVM